MQVRKMQSISFEPSNKRDTNYPKIWQVPYTVELHQIGTTKRGMQRFQRHITLKESYSDSSMRCQSNHKTVSTSHHQNNMVLLYRNQPRKTHLNMWMQQEYEQFNKLLDVYYIIHKQWIARYWSHLAVLLANRRELPKILKERSSNYQTIQQPNQTQKSGFTHLV